MKIRILLLLLTIGLTGCYTDNDDMPNDAIKFIQVDVEQGPSMIKVADAATLEEAKLIFESIGNYESLEGFKVTKEENEIIFDSQSKITSASVVEGELLPINELGENSFSIERPVTITTILRVTQGY